MGKLSLNDIVSLSNFRTWVKNNINIYDDKEISDDHLAIVIEHIEEIVKGESFPHERLLWFKSLNNLREEWKRYESFRERHPED